MSSDSYSGLHSLSNVFGWAYFLAWSASCYPQPLLNWQRKSVHGLSMAFTYLNLVGFSAYAAYNTALYYNSHIREQYRNRHHGEDSLVQFNDVVFGLHAFVLALITVIQTFIYPVSYMNLMINNRYLYFKRVILKDVVHGLLLY
jgi:cystinosin